MYYFPTNDSFQNMKEPKVSGGIWTDNDEEYVIWIKDLYHSATDAPILQILLYVIYSGK